MRSEYERKYTIELKPLLGTGFRYISLQDMRNFYLMMYRRYDELILKDSNMILLELGHYCIILYDATRVLKKCQEDRSFTRFLTYKEV